MLTGSKHYMVLNITAYKYAQLLCASNNQEANTEARTAQMLGTRRVAWTKELEPVSKKINLR